MRKVAIIGAGHAGVEAAFTLAKAGVQVTLFTNEPCLPYFRPRLIGVAFGQTASSAIAIKPEAAYAQAGITLCHEAVDRLDVQEKRVNGCTYDGVVLAQGSRPFVPPFKGEGATRVQTLWNMADALALNDSVKLGMKVAIIGGGVLGLEAALRAVLAGLQVTVIEAAPALLGGVLGEGAEGVLRATLEAKGISLKIGVAVAEVLADAVVLVDGSRIEAALVLCSAGARPNAGLATAAGLPIAEGVRTNPDLSITSGVYAAGDLAYPSKQRPVCAVMRAMRMGALAANNLLAEFDERPGTLWKEPRLPLFMKVEEVEFHTIGEVRAQDVTEERIDDQTDARIWKSVLRRGEQVVGLRWVGTRADFATWEKQLPPQQ